MGATEGSTWAAGGAAFAGTSSAGVGAGMAAAAAGAAVGNAAGQLVGDAEGIHQGFSWGEVAAAGLTAGATAGIGSAVASEGGDFSILAHSNGTPTTFGYAVEGAADYVAGVGANKLVGEPTHFSWAGAVANAVGSAVTSAAHLPTKSDNLLNSSVGQAFEGRLVDDVVTRETSLALGDNHVQSWQQIAEDVFGNALGNAAIAGIKQYEEENKRWALLEGQAEALGTTAQSIETARQNGLSVDETAKELLQAQSGKTFSDAVQSPYVKAVFIDAGYSPNRPITPQDLEAQLAAGTDGLSAQDRLDTIKGNIADFIGQAKQNAIAGEGGDTIGVALAQNSALLAVYSALAITMPNFQWTYTGAFVAYQVRGQLLNIYDAYTNSEERAASVFNPEGAANLANDRDHLINTIINGQIGVVEDIGSLALTYRQVGADILQAPEIAKDRTALQGFQDQIKADTSMANGDYAKLILAGEQAAVQFGIREQTDLQSMWDDPLLKSVAQGLERGEQLITAAKQNAIIGHLIPSGLRLLDTTIYTPIGAITAPSGANDVTNLQDRIAIANNAFNYMYQNLYAGPNNANWAKVTDVLSMRMDPSTLPQRPRILGISL